MDLHNNKDDIQKNTNLYDETNYNSDLRSRLINKIKTQVCKSSEVIKTNNAKN